MDNSSNPKVAVIGAGCWGRNLVRNFYQLGALEMVCDERQPVLDEMHLENDVRTTRDINNVLEAEDVPDYALDGRRSRETSGLDVPMRRASSKPRLHTQVPGVQSRIHTIEHGVCCEIKSRSAIGS